MPLTAFGALLLLLAVAAPVPSMEVAATHALLTLERAFPVGRGVGLSELRDRDRVRHTRMLSQSDSVVSGIADFALGGTYNPLFIGLYYAKVQIGTPPEGVLCADRYWERCAVDFLHALLWLPSIQWFEYSAQSVRSQELVICL
ncbi:hypothetical protein MLD38_009570 [Melastoma candidum]|uniref:Uncharacterized protein n=1 Tax=Melastoma candidum TaxID=119954 RepID=A0ACB9RZG6_9MYRT|nr:hypothetical protein MLD38_009570 [Melastoma candidum]